MDLIQLWQIVVLLFLALVGGAVIAVLVRLARKGAPRRIDRDRRSDRDRRGEN